jgi:hypothetical protein
MTLAALTPPQDQRAGARGRWAGTSGGNEKVAADGSGPERPLG